MPHPDRYSISELADLAGVTPRTIRYYLSQGLLPSPGATGPGVKYGDEHLDRLRLIRGLQRQHLPLAEIRTQLAGLSSGRIAALVDEVPMPADIAQTAASPDTAIDYIRRILAPAPRPDPGPLRRVVSAEAPAPYPAPSVSILAGGAPVLPAVEPDDRPDPIERSQWERITLATDIELHVRRPLPRTVSRKVDRLVTIARELLEEDPS